MRIYLLIGLLLVGCGKPDYSKPHEYIRAIGYGENWVSTNDNTYKFHLPDITVYTYSEIGSGLCEKNLAEMEAEEIYLHMAAVNGLIHSEYDGRHDVPIKYVKLQCVSYYGQDQGCVASQLEKSKKISKVYERAAEDFLLLTLDACDIKKVVGQIRTFSLDESKKYKFVPK